MFAMEDQKILTYAIAETVLSSAKADTALRAASILSHLHHIFSI